MSNQDDEVAMLIEHDELMTKFFVTLSSPAGLSMQELSASLRLLADDIDADPTQFQNSFTNAEFDCH